MQLAIDFDAPAAAPELPDYCCPFCEEDLVYGDLPSILCLDIRFGEGEQFAVFQPCCVALAQEVAWYGYEDAMGISVERALSIIGGFEVLEVVAPGFDAHVVARLAVRNPTEVTEKRDRNGNLKAKSPKGWQAEVFTDIEAHHSHHEAPNGWKFGVAVYNGLVKVGVMVVGTPSSRALMQAQPHTAEVTRGCILPAAAPLRKNAATKLYGACAAQAKALGYDRLVTYTMADESGHSLIAAGWTITGRSTGGSWDRDSRTRTTKDSKTDITGEKVRWEKGLTKKARKAVAAAAIN